MRPKKTSESVFFEKLLRCPKNEYDAIYNLLEVINVSDKINSRLF